MKKKTLLVMLMGAVILFGTGFAVVKNQNKFTAPSKTENQGTSQTEGKSDNPPKEEAQAIDSSVPTPVVNSNVSELKDVSLTVYLNGEASTSQDGKTTIPPNSLSPFFYLPSGVYTVQKFSSGAWVDVATSINHPGHGGLAGGFTSPTEDNINYRVLKIENGKVTAVSKTFVVKRANLGGGVYTYN